MRDIRGKEPNCEVLVRNWIKRRGRIQNEMLEDCNFLVDNGYAVGEAKEVLVRLFCRKVE